jgi:hypothetical protein
MALETPEVRFDAISQSTGFETIEKAKSLLKSGKELTEGGFPKN